MTAPHIDPSTLARILGGDHSGNNVTAPGPNNIDRRNDRSMSVTVNPDAPEGFVVHSHSAKNTDMECRDYVRRLAGLPEWKPTPREPDKPKPKPSVVCHYVYEDQNGEPYLRVTRKSDKTFPQSHWDIDGWQSGKPSGPVIPYRLPEILANTDQVIHLVEGEKSADYLRSRGLVATTAPGGGSAFPTTDEFAVWFDGQHVRAYPDNDATGRKWAERVAARLPHADIVWLPGQPEKSGADDWLQRDGRTIDDLIGAVSVSADYVHESETPDEPPPLRTFTPTPFELGDPTQIPPRQWVYDFRLIRGFVSLTVAPGGLGKSSLAMVDSLSMATGRALFQDSPFQEKHPIRVWYWNGEDPQEETRRRIAAIALHYGIKNDDIAGRLFTDTGRETEIILGGMSGHEIEVNETLFSDLEKTILANRIDVLIIDPFSSAHRLPENDNSAINPIARRLAKLADRCNAAVEIVHHTRKTNGAEITVEDGRGASSMRDAVRSARALNVMSYDDIGRDLGFSEDECKTYFSVGVGKASMSSKASGVQWRRLVSVPLGNATPERDEDTVGVVTYYELKREDEKTERTNNLANTESVILDIVKQNDMTRHWGGRNVPPKGWLGKAVIDRMGLINVPNGKINHVIRNMLNDGKLILRSTREAGNEVSCYTLPGASERADTYDPPDYSDDPF